MEEQKEKAGNKRVRVFPEEVRRRSGFTDACRVMHASEHLGLEIIVSSADPREGRRRKDKKCGILSYLPARSSSKNVILQPKHQSFFCSCVKSATQHRITVKLRYTHK